MKKFIVIYHATPEALAKMNGMTPEQMQEGMKPWFAWKERMGENLLDFGSPLFGGMRVLPDGGSKPSTKDVSGYSMIQAEDMEAAKKMMQDHPHYGYGGGCDIELHEVSPM